MADTGSLLGQLLGAALSNGGVRGGQVGNNAANGLPGALGDVLGQVLGGGAARSGGASGGAGGLGDLLGQVLGGATRGQSTSGPSGGLGGGLGDLLGQVLGGGATQSGPSGGLSGGLGDLLGQVLGGGAAQGGAQGGAPRGGSLGGGLGDMADAALGSGASSSVPSTGSSHLPSPSPAPKSAPSSSTQPAGGNDLVKYGGLAVIGMLALNAFRKWQAQGGQGRSNFVSDPSAADGFVISNVPGGPEAFSSVLLAAMVAAAQSDGQIDQDEFNRIVGGLEKIGASGADQQALIEYLSVPVDPQILISAAVTPQAASAIYVASLMAIQPDHPAEQRYLAQLASRLGIDPALKAQLDVELAAA